MTQLTPQQQKKFQEYGYLVIPDALPPTQVSRLIKVLNEISKETPEKIHNEADILGLRDEFLERHVIFIQYAFRWLCPVDAMTVEHLRSRCDPIRLQLLGLSTTTQNIDGAAGRSGRYHPSLHEVPLGKTYSQQFRETLFQQLRWWRKRIMKR